MHQPLTIGRPRWFDSLPSTNGWLRDRILAGNPVQSGTLIAARTQTAGRGRGERSWISGEGDIACSLFLVSRRPTSEWPSLSMACSLAVAEALGEFGLAGAVKWPNDVLVNEKKICGILAEIASVAGKLSGIILGIGLNVNMTAEACAAVGKPATSMALESGAIHEPGVALDVLARYLESLVNRWEAGGFPAIRDEWKSRAHRLGREIRVEGPDACREGIFHDVGRSGELILARNGVLTTILLGEVE